MTLLDALGHLTDGAPLLSAISGLLHEHRAIGVLSVPNVTRQDLAAKLLLGRWDYTETGLLDSTHAHLYSAEALRESLGEHGMEVFDTHDVVLPVSDQHSPANNVALSESPVGVFLRGLRTGVDQHGSTNQFIWAVRPATAPRPDAAPGRTGSNHSSASSCPPTAPTPKRFVSRCCA